MRQYRERLRDDRESEPLQFLSRVNLVAKLGEELAYLDKYRRGEGASAIGDEYLPDMQEGATDLAGQTINEILRRYGIKLPRRRTST